MATVYVVNKGGHNFTPAKQFGELIYLTEGTMNPFAVDKMYREIAKKISNSNADDYILVTGLTIMNSLACACFTQKHSRLNLLLFRNGKYISRTVMVDSLL